MRNIIFCLITCILFIVACGELSGIFNVKKDIYLINKKNKKIEIVPKSYPTKIKFNEKKSRIELAVNKNTFYFLMPGDFFERSLITSSENGQPYDVSISVTKDVTESPIYSDYLSCVAYYQNSYICNHHGQCSWQTIPIYGIQHYEYHYEYLTIKTKGTLLDNSEEVADFNAIRKETERVIDYIGFCH